MEKRKEKIEQTRIGKKDLKIKSDSGKKSSIKQEKGLFLFHSRTPCYGQCPVYTLKVKSNGKAELKAEQFTELEKGHYKGKVSEQKIEALQEKARAIDFFELDKVYDDEDVTDLPSRTTRMHFDGKGHEVRNRYEGPDGLEELEELIHSIVEETDWKREASDE